MASSPKQAPPWRPSVASAAFLLLLPILQNVQLAFACCFPTPAEAKETSQNWDVGAVSRWRRSSLSTKLRFPLVALQFRGGGYSASSTDVAGEEDDASEIRDLIDRLSRTVQQEGRGEQRGYSEKEASKEEEARMWRRLGRRLLDAGERAESARVFRHGARRCPDDNGLAHHLRVYEAFHGAEGAKAAAADGGAASSSPTVETPPPPQDGYDLLRPDPSLLVSFGVPPEAVPLSALSACRQHADATQKQGLRHVLAPRIVHATARPVLPPSACSYAVEAAVRAAEQRGGYTTDRHVHAPTCDVPSFELDEEASEWVRDVLRRTLFPLLESAFPQEMEVRAGELRVQDCFVVRYDGDDNECRPGFASLRPHEDESLLSLTVALNDMSEYDGGGLFIAPTGDLLNGDAGTLMCFAGGLVHGGYPVARGTRWILTAFLYVDRNDSRKEVGYVLREIIGEGVI